MSMSKVTVTPIEFTSNTNNKGLNFNTKIRTTTQDNKPALHKFQTGWMYTKYPIYASSKFVKNEEDRNYIKFEIDNNAVCEQLRQQLEDFDKDINSQYEQIFGEKRAKLHEKCVSIKDPKIPTDLEIELAKEEGKTLNPNPLPKFKIKLDFNNNCYYNGELLDFDNAKLVLQTYFGALNQAGGKPDKMKPVTYKLQIKNKETGKIEDIVATMDEVQIRKENKTAFFVRNSQNSYDEKTRPINMSQEDLDKFYGKAEEVEAKTPEQIDQYLTYNSWYRLIFSPEELWANKEGDKVSGKRNTGIKYVCKQIEIIKFPNQYRNADGVKNTYKKYGFVDTNTTTTTTTTKVQTKNESESDSESESSAEDNSESDSESESESESESDSESDEPVVSKKKVAKETKSTKQVSAPSKKK